MTCFPLGGLGFIVANFVHCHIVLKMVCTIRVIVVSLFVASPAVAFSIGGGGPKCQMKTLGSIPVLPQHSYQKNYRYRYPPTSSVNFLSSSNDNEGDRGIFNNFNPLYGALWATFLTYGLALSPGQIGDPLDFQMIQSYIDNPTAPEGINPLFLIIFNGLGIMPLVIAQLACPQGNKVGGVPAAPFLAASMAMGFGAAGFYLTFRSPPVEQKTQTEASWFTRTILENKLASVASIALLGAAIVSAMNLMEDGQTISSVLSDYISLTSQSKFVSTSSLDLVILTISAATLIPRDLQLRSQEDTTTLGRNIALGTLVVPIVGAILYCLWRPQLPKD